ncbi:CRISPR-associated endonuclease Cas2 [Streptococcus suis]|uniref:CRISPR-associated endonuclease Cas2 n=1 Tax=Streptococcus suis TaxID=1307 RepID=UPI00094397A8|nr:CRISPR-associated endonuclease Cas2 [Streptococcus suis]HEM2554238.1 CRISPR-associated endonuclease Cas2 [Streptococcus suis]
MRYDAMRLLCFFDLPMETTQEKRQYRLFRKELIANGFEMLQFSVYYRTCPNRSFATKFYKKLQQSHIPAGNVRLLAVTEKQFSEMVLIVGGKTRQEEAISDRKLVII